MEERLKNNDIVTYCARIKDDKPTTAYFFQIINMNARDALSGERMVVFRAVFNSYNMPREITMAGKEVTAQSIFTLPYEQFVAKADKEKYPDTVQEYAFENIKVSSEKENGGIW